MTLDEAIKHCEEKAKELREQPFKEKMDIEDIATCEECAEEHEQLAEWLKELKALKGSANEPKGDLISRSALREAIFKRQYYIDGVDEVYNAIDNAQAVEITEKQAILLLINSGWLVNHDKELREKWERPQSEWLCPNCYLYEQTNDDYCQYAGECTINCRKCKYFKQKGDAE